MLNFDDDSVKFTIIIIIKFVFVIKRLYFTFCIEYMKKHTCLEYYPYTKNKSK